MSEKKIKIIGAKEHNLKNINLEIPRDKLVVITGLSGSGKSSLAFDTIYAEGQRRYVESLSAYARQFLEQMGKPDVESISGLSPAISIEQRTASHNPRSTVGTVTEIHDHLRLLFARVGVPHCYKCGRDIRGQTVQEITDQVLCLPKDTKIQILAPLVRGRKGEYQKVFAEAQKAGFIRVRVDGTILEIGSNIRLDKKKKHNIEVIVDRLVLKPEVKKRLTDSLETALKLGQGTVIVVKGTEKKKNRDSELLFSELYACPECAVSYEELTPRMFSFNSPYGACKTCSGLGTKMEVDPDLVVPDKSKSIWAGAIEPWSNPITTRRHRWKKSASHYYYDLLEEAAKDYGFSLRKPFSRLSAEQQKIVLYGKDYFEGVVSNLERRHRETESEYVREEIYRKYVNLHPCPDCRGARLRPESLAVTVAGQSIERISRMSIKEASRFFSLLTLSKQEMLIARQIFKEIRERLKFLTNVGLDYVSLDRKSSSLSGGEAERIRLATQIGSSLVGVLYILDEPTIGLHQRDNRRLHHTLRNLRDLGNTVLLVEHDEATIRAADYIIDLGPGAGERGGKVVASGPLEKILRCKESLTGQYLKGELRIEVPEKRKAPRQGFLEIRGVRHNNLKNLDIRIPLGLFVCVTGVSGSGKSSLIDETLFRALAQHFHGSRVRPGDYDEIRGLEYIDKVIDITQDPIGRTPRSNPATYTGSFTPIRELFAQIPESKMRGYSLGRFSFNVKGGRCEACKGDGIIKIEMHFLPDVYIPCETCKGARYNRETLGIRYKGKNIAEVLDMTAEEALDFFKNIPRIKRKLQTINDVGLSYIKLGQFATTLSGGEAQRVKLSTELSKLATGRTFYILDEPTTGLHFADIRKLLDVLKRLTETGNTVVVIEHNLDMIKTADYIIDLGPEGGDEGGKIVAQGPPEKLARVKSSYTGQFLKKVLAKSS